MIQAIATVLDFAPPHWSSGVRMTAVVLGDYANGDTAACWPSVSSIARRTGLSERQVQRNLRTIEADGWITKAPETLHPQVGTNLWIWVKRVRVG